MSPMGMLFALIRDFSLMLKELGLRCLKALLNNYGNLMCWNCTTISRENAAFTDTKFLFRVTGYDVDFLASVWTKALAW
jgi:hypothetical protein